MSFSLTLMGRELIDRNQVSNPFHGISPGSYQSSNDDTLHLIDGGASDPITNLPLWPLIQPSRKVDVIFAIDDSVSQLALVAVLNIDRRIDLTLNTGRYI